MPHRSTRREFLRNTALTGAGALVVDRSLLAANQQPNDRIRFACIGVGGQGRGDSQNVARLGEIVAICDIDDGALEQAAQRHPSARKYHDFRKMLEEFGDGIDAVTVSIPDHGHAVAAGMAMKMGKHCYCQKPLTRTIWEARRLGEIAREAGVTTQMGNQHTANANLRRAAALVQAGAVGTVKEVHAWTNRPIWPQGIDRPNPADVPGNVHWDLWLGPARPRPYVQRYYHRFNWRGWWEFGTGALGDMACHTLNLPFHALDLRDPVSVYAETPGHNGDSFPDESTVVFEFPARGQRPALTLTWQDGGRKPDPELLGGQDPANSGCVIIGERGSLYAPGDYAQRFQLLGGAEEVEVEFERSPGHFEEWARAIRGEGRTVSNFAEYAAGFTETILLGNLAIWQHYHKIEWDAANLKPTNHPELEWLVRPWFRYGYHDIL